MSPLKKHCTKITDQNCGIVFLKKITKMRTVQLNVPDCLDLKAYNFSMIIAAKLYEDARLSA